MSTLTVGEGVDVLLPGTQETQKVRANILAGLTDTQENQIVTKAFVRNNSSDNATERRNRFTACSAVLLFHGTPSYLRNVNNLSSFFSKRSLTFAAVSLFKFLSDICR
jgi:hypothetical protein